MKYWMKKGKHQDRFNTLTKLVPQEGHSEDQFIELIRVTQNVYYDLYNNGGCNIGRAGRSYDWLGIIYLLDIFDFVGDREGRVLFRLTGKTFSDWGLNKRDEEQLGSLLDRVWDFICEHPKAREFLPDGYVPEALLA